MSTFNFTGSFSFAGRDFLASFDEPFSRVVDEFEFTVGDANVIGSTFTFTAADASQLSQIGFAIFDVETGLQVTSGAEVIPSSGRVAFEVGNTLEAGKTYRFLLVPTGEDGNGAMGGFDLTESYNYSLTAEVDDTPGNGIFEAATQINERFVFRASGTGSANYIGNFRSTDQFLADLPDVIVAMAPSTAQIADQYLVSLNQAPANDAPVVFSFTGPVENAVVFDAVTGEIIDVEFEPVLDEINNPIMGQNTVTVDPSNFGDAIANGFLIKVVSTAPGTDPIGQISYDFAVTADGAGISINELDRVRVAVAPFEEDFGGPLTLNAETAQLLYVAYYGRPADPDGLEFWSNAIAEQEFEYTPNGGDVLTGASLDFYNTFTTQFGTSDEAGRLFDGVTNFNIVNTIYNFAFNRDADTAGRDFWVSQINLGNVSSSTAAIEIALGATGSDRSIIRNKIESADLVTAGLGADPDLVPNYTEISGRNFLAPFGASVATPAQVNVFLAGLA